MDIELKKWKERGNYFHYNKNKIFYIKEGEGNCVLILHGYPFSSFEWKIVFEQLIKTNTVIAIDLLGMGFSDKPQNHHYSYQEYCRIITAVLLMLNIEKVTVFAHDLGVSISQELLALDSEQQLSFNIEAIAFMNGGLFMEVYKPRMIQKLLSQTPDFIGKLVNQLLTKQMILNQIKKLFGSKSIPSDSFFEQQWEILTFNNGKSIAYILGKLVFDKYEFQSRWINAMQKTNIPMCYIHGPIDPNSGLHMAVKYAQLIPMPLVYTLDKNVGHWPQIEDPNAVLNAFYDFTSIYIK